MPSDEDHFSAYISPTEDILEEARNGRMFILVDHEDRENEGDLVIPGQMATPDAINFMATHGRGLICLTLTADRIEQLGLNLMSTNNLSRHETAFTVSIEAREGVTTGISAHDRARTVAVAIDSASTRDDIATPGHVFPLRAKDGGVLVRAGHTEAAVDVSRLAGLNPSGVICEIMNDDGTMARLPDLVTFAQLHNLKIGTISDLIAWRRRHDNLVKEVAETKIESMIGGEWTLKVFNDTASGGEHLALIKGDIDADGPVLVRMHQLDPLEDLFALSDARWQQAPDAMAAIAAEERGVIVLLRDMEPNAISAKLANTDAPKQLRQYGVGAQILASLGIQEIELLSNSPLPSVVGLDAYGLTITGLRPIPKRKG
ncbi:MAG: 3,4-dihydroxy-2-butanone-4-phosphate synthase [Pikeienuella sp.]